MSKKAISIVLSVTTAVWLCGVGMLPAHGQTVEELQAQIEALLAQIASLQAQLAELEGAPAAVCHEFKTDLYFGMKNDDVKALQEILIAEKPDIWQSEVGATGYFGPITKAAVIKYQEKYAAEILTPLGLTAGTGYVGPSTRAYLNKCVAPEEEVEEEVVEEEVVEEEVAEEEVVEEEIPVGITFSLAEDTPVAASVPKKAGSLPFLKVKLYGSGTIHSITFTRVGVGSAGDFGSVYLYDGEVKLTTGRSINTTTHKVTFTSLNLAIEGEKILELRAEPNTDTSGGVHAFEISSADDISATEAVSGTFPIRGNSMSFAAVDAGSITISKVGSLADPKVGQVGVKLTEFRLAVGTTEQVTLQRIALYQGGSVSRGNITNLQLKDSLGNVLATAEGVNGRDQAVFVFDPVYTLDKGVSRTFSVYGDISGAVKPNETIKFYLDETTDLQGIGGRYGFPVRVTNSFDSTAANHHALTVKGGLITITFNGPAIGDIGTGLQDVTLFDFNISSQINVEVRKIVFEADFENLNTGEGEFDDCKLVDVDSGLTLTSVITPDADPDTWTFTDIFTINKDSSRHLKVTCDTSATALEGNETVTITLKQWGDNYIKNLDNNQWVDASESISPYTDLTGNKQSVKTVDLESGLAGIPSSRTIVAGATNEGLLGFFLRAVAGDVKVNTIKITADAVAGDDAQLRNDLKQIGLYVGDVLISDVKSFVTDTGVSVITFNNLAYTIPNGQSRTITVKAGQIANNATQGNKYAVYIANLSTDISASDPDGNPLSLTGSIGSATLSPEITIGVPTLTISKIDDTSTEAGLVVADGERLLAAFDFFAKYADITVTKLKVGVNDTGNTADTATTTALKEEVQEIRLYKDNVMIAFGTPDATPNVPDSGRVKFSNDAGIFTVPANTTVRIEVRGLLALDTAAGATTGSKIYALIDDDDAEWKAGTLSSTTLTDAPVAGNLKVLYKTIPTVTAAAPTSNLLTIGDREVIKFTVAADANNDLDWKQIKFECTLNNATLTADSVEVWTGGTQLTLATATIAAGGGTGIANLATAERITAGTSKTYEIYVNVAEVAGGTTPASIVTKLLAGGDAYVSSAAANTILGTAANRFVWSDRSILPHGETEASWTNGYYVKTLPSPSYSLVK